jgi:hypothetical protein
MSLLGEFCLLRFDNRQTQDDSNAVGGSERPLPWHLMTAFDQKRTFRSCDRTINALESTNENPGSWPGLC